MKQSIFQYANFSADHSFVYKDIIKNDDEFIKIDTGYDSPSFAFWTNPLINTILIYRDGDIQELWGNDAEYSAKLREYKNWYNKHGKGFGKLISQDKKVNKRIEDLSLTNI